MPANTKFSKLQKFILTKALKRWSSSEQDAEMFNSMLSGLNPDAVPTQADRLEQVSRNEILISFFGLSLRKGHSYGEDYEQNRIDREAAGHEAYHCANVSLYRALERLERRGLIKRMTKRSDWQLTQAGISAARTLVEQSVEQPT